MPVCWRFSRASPACTARVGTSTGRLKLPGDSVDHRGHDDQRLRSTRPPGFAPRAAEGSLQGASAGCGAIFDPPRLTEQIEALEERMRAPGFWDDQEQASGVSAEYSRAKRRLAEFGELEARFADLESTEELLREELAGGAVDATSSAGARRRRRRPRDRPPARRGDALLQRQVRRGRRHPHHPSGRRRHRVAGLGGDAAAHVCCWFERRGFKVEIIDCRTATRRG